MSFKTSSVRLVCVLVAVAWAASAQAQIAKHSIAGSNLRYQIGNGLPIPITTAAPPAGNVVAVPGASIMQITGAAPQKITIVPSQLTWPGPLINLPIFGANPAIFEVATQIAIQWPRSTVTLQAGGRTGPSIVTFCPGSTAALPNSTYNPSCTNPLATGLPTTGLMRYVATANQFGGPVHGALQGIATIGLVAAGAPPPCDFATGACMAIFAAGPPAQTAADGAPFGWFNSTPGGAPPTGLFNARVTTSGAITYVTPTGLGPGLGNPALSYGAPFTTGQVMVSARSTIGGGTERFTRTGTDNRNATGSGTMSLVASAVSMRGLSGPNANRGWLNLTVPEPTTALSAAGAFLLLAACHGLVRRRSR